MSDAQKGVKYAGVSIISKHPNKINELRNTPVAIKSELKNFYSATPNKL